MRSTTHRSIVIVITLGIPCGSVAAGESSKQEKGWLVRMGPVSPISHPPGAHPMFEHWTFCAGESIICRFEGLPNTNYQVFIGLTEAYWDKPEQRIVDLEVAGTKRLTVDSYQGAKGTPHGYLFPASTDAKGELLVRIAPHIGSPDQNPAVCGLLLFPDGIDLRVSDIVNNRGPKPLVAVLAGTAHDRRLRNRGAYFSKKRYTRRPLPVWTEQFKKRLPEPIFDENPDYLRCYWRTWELAFRHFRQPAPRSPFVSNYIDENFNESLFLWDTAFMTMFCNYAYRDVPGIESLDNFYCTQLEDGEIVREISEVTGKPNPASRPGTPDSLNHPILAWAEREAYRISGDRKRLEMVYQPLVRYYRSFETIRDEPSGFYRTSWASMDNSPRIQGMKCGIDTAAEMVLFARDLAYIAREIGRDQEAEAFEAQAERLSRKINERLWDEQTGFYYDWSVDGKRHNVQTIAAYWTLLADVASPKQRERLIQHLKDENKFRRPHMIPTVPADQEGYHPDGHYWRGGVWTPTDTMVVRGLERCGHHELAREIALNHLDNVVDVFKRTGTLWEFYAPDEIKPGIQPGHSTRRDFVGWTGIAPIVFLIEHAIGIRVDAPSRTITWNIHSPKRVGVKRLWFGGRTVSLICDAAGADGTRLVEVRTDKPFTLTLIWNDIKTTQEIPGNQTTSIPVGQKGVGSLIDASETAPEVRRE
jgi:hypothetical protein